MKVDSNGITLEVEDHGSPLGEPLLLIMGLGMQLVAWHDDFVAALVKEGFRVVRFDNRDIGLSQHLDHLGLPNMPLDLLKYSLGFKLHSPYSLRDMADDAAGVLDALQITSAHVCGASMGGMIAQHLAARRPERVKSLCLLMTASGARRLPKPALAVRKALVSRPSAKSSFQSAVNHAVNVFKLIGSPDHPEIEDELAQRVAASMRRSFHPQGATRQLIAVVADGDRSNLLGDIKAPTVILHGAQDPLIPVAAAHDLAAKISGAQIDIIDGMGHDLPRALWPRFIQGIQSAAVRAIAPVVTDPANPHSA